MRQHCSFVMFIIIIVLLFDPCYLKIHLYSENNFVIIACMHAIKKLTFYAIKKVKLKHQ